MDKSIKRIAAAVLSASLFAVPMFAAARGTADFTRFVALGDSYGAGVVNGSLNENHQPYSWPAIIARQAGASFVQPTVSFPGIGAELQLKDAVSYPPVIAPAAGSGQPTNLTYQGIYNNLSIPGATVGDLTTITGKENPPKGTAQSFAQFILRGQGTAVDQAIAAHPTFVAIWIGGNDLLGAALAGTPALLTSVDNFRTAYNAMLDKLTAGAPNAGMVVGTLPTHVSVAPVTSTVAPFIVNPATRQPVLGADGKPIYLVADLGGGNFGQLPVGSMVLLTASGRLATGYGIPAALKAVPPFNQLPDVGKPLPDSDVLTPTEVAAIEARAAEFNNVITTAASARNIPVADITGWFDHVYTHGIDAGPFTFTKSYITGGIFGLDGFHLTDLGYTFFANEFIRTINNAYGTDIPVASITSLFADNGALFPKTSSGAIFVEGTPWEMSAEAAAQIRSFGPETPLPTRRLRTVGH